MSDLATPSAASDVTVNDPVTELDRAFQRLSREVFEALPPFGGLAFLREGLPSLADVEDAGAQYQLAIDLPGVPKEKIDVRVHGTVVSVKAEVVEEPHVRAYLLRERSFRRLEREIELPEPVLSEQVTAEYKDGVLRLTLPKAHPTTDRKVPVA